MVSLLSDGYVDRAVEIKEKSSLSAEAISSQEVQVAVWNEMVTLLSQEYIAFETVNKLKNDFSVSPEDLCEVGKEAMIYHLSAKSGYYQNALEIKDKLNLTAEIVSSPEVQEAAKGKVARLLSKGKVNSAIEVWEKFSLPASVLASPEVQKGAKDAIIDRLLSNDYNSIGDALRIKNKFAVADEVLASPEVQNAAMEVMTARLSEDAYNYVEYALEIKEKFSLSETSCFSAVVKGMENQLLKGCVSRAIKIKDYFAVPADHYFSGIPKKGRESANSLYFA